MRRDAPRGQGNILYSTLYFSYPSVLCTPFCAPHRSSLCIGMLDTQRRYYRRRGSSRWKLLDIHCRSSAERELLTLQARCSPASPFFHTLGRLEVPNTAARFLVSGDFRASKLDDTLPLKSSAIPSSGRMPHLRLSSGTLSISLLARPVCNRTHSSAYSDPPTSCP